MLIELRNRKGFVSLLLNKRLFLYQSFVNMQFNTDLLFFKKKKFNNQYNIFLTYVYVYKYMLHFGLISNREFQKR